MADHAASVKPYRPIRTVTITTNGTTAPTKRITKVRVSKKLISSPQAARQKGFEERPPRRCCGSGTRRDGPSDRPPLGGKSARDGLTQNTENRVVAS